MVDLQALQNTFRERYGTEPRLFSAPGRANLIGEHTDYNAGFVLPIAANLRTYVAAGARNDHSFRVYSCNLQDEVKFQLGPLETKQRGWFNYVYGVSQVLKDAGHDLKGADVVIASEVPRGAGLSSSAALEVSFGFALLQLNAREIDPLELAQAAQSAEHSFVGTKSGLMDQLTAIFAKADHALLIDCRSLEITAIPLRMNDLAVVICDSKVKHELATSAYNQRRAECEQAVELLGQKKPGINSLRDLTAVDLDLIETLPEPMRRRARHVITENERTLLAAEAIKVENFQFLGELMMQSHRSLRDDYDVSCQELDLLVELASAHEAVLGSRMMGGGFGGCTVNLVRLAGLKEFQNWLTLDYRRTTGLSPEVYVIHADSGVREHQTV